MSQTLTYRAPAYLGDTLRARVEVLSLEPDNPACQLKFEVLMRTESAFWMAKAGPTR